MTMQDKIRNELDALHICEVAKHFGALKTASQTLYHYTSLESAYHIINSGKLRYTNMLYLNDPNEISEALEMAEDVFPSKIKEWVEKQGGSKAYVLLLPYLSLVHTLRPISRRSDTLKEIKTLCDELGLPNDVIESCRPFWDRTWSIYIFCLSERSDALRQWVPYADNAKGVALGFTGVRDNCHNITEDSRYIVKVNYSSNQTKKDYINSYIDKALSYYEEELLTLAGSMTSEQYWEEYDFPFIRRLTLTFIEDVVACKNSSYEDEEEWRIFEFIDNEHYQLGSHNYPDFYCNNGYLKPFHDYRFQRDSLLDIKLGPLANKLLNEDALRLLMQKHKHSNVDIITESEVKYRE